MSQRDEVIARLEVVNRYMGHQEMIVDGEEYEAGEAIEAAIRLLRAPCENCAGSRAPMATAAVYGRAPLVSVRLHGRRQQVSDKARLDWLKVVETDLREHHQQTAADAIAWAVERLSPTPAEETGQEEEREAMRLGFEVLAQRRAERASTPPAAPTTPSTEGDSK